MKVLKSASHLVIALPVLLGLTVVIGVCLLGAVIEDIGNSITGD